jgi:hypothetical protein
MSIKFEHTPSQRKPTVANSHTGNSEHHLSLEKGKVNKLPLHTNTIAKTKTSEQRKIDKTKC